MKKIVIWFLGFSLCGFSQSADHASKNVLNSLYSNAALKTYATSSQLKIEDFYNYLSLYSDTENSGDLKKELVVSIKQLLGNKEVLIKNIFSEKETSISINDFLISVLEKNILFKVKNPQLVTSNFFIGWSISYDLEVLDKKSQKIIQKFSLLQTVFFENETKKYGSKIKEVRSIFIGDIKSN